MDKSALGKVGKNAQRKNQNGKAERDVEETKKVAKCWMSDRCIKKR